MGRDCRTQRHRKINVEIGAPPKKIIFCPTQRISPTARSRHPPRFRSNVEATPTHPKPTAYAKQ